MDVLDPTRGERGWLRSMNYDSNYQMNAAVEKPGLRQRKREATLRRVQDAALDLFDAHGFDAVTVEQIANAADVSSPTIYRLFSSKEGIVFWDGYDPMVAGAISRRLPGKRVIEALVGALVDSANQVYARDRARILRRARLVRAHASLRAAQAALYLGLRHELADRLRGSGAAQGKLEAQVLAGALVATFEVAVDEWVARRGRVSLARVFERAFEHLRGIEAARAKPERSS